MPYAVSSLPYVHPISPEPTKSEAKKKFRMNVYHYRSKNKEAMTQLCDAFRRTCGHQRDKPKPL